MRGQSLIVVMVFAMQCGDWLVAESPNKRSPALANGISEVIPIKYALASDVAAALDADKSGHGRNWMNRALATTAGITNLHAQVQALGLRRITWDERSNSLLVTSSASELPKIKEIIDKLDVVLPQVLIEAAIIEFPMNCTNNLALSLNSKEGCIPPSLIALTNFAVLSSTALVLNELTNRSGSRGDPLSYEAVITSDLDTLQLGMGNRGGKILQRPRIQTSVGVPATLWVGLGVPVPPQSSYYGGGATSCGCETIERLQGGATLEVTCGLVEDDFILADIKQRIDEFAGNVNIQNVGSVPTYNPRTSEAHVGVHNGQIIALNVVGRAKEPIFSELPILDKVPLAGHFLNRVITSPTRTKPYEFMVLIRPKILVIPEMRALTAQQDRMPGIKALEMQLRAEELKHKQGAKRNQGSDSE